MQTPWLTFASFPHKALAEPCIHAALKKAFAENEEVQEMAQNNFIMLNLMHETTDKNLSPDGQYVPRIMFIGAAMEKSYVSVFLLLVAISCVLAKDVGKKDTKETNTKPKLPQTLSRGWGDQLIWTQTYEEALFRAKHSNKPLMIIHHLDDCPHSQALKKVFAEHKEIQKLAEKFILLNLVYETTDKNLAPDGQYVPRILFIDPSLTVRADITGRYSNRLYAYEPSDISLLYSNMQKALKLLKTEL
ncbi:Anterior gradient protein 2-like protein isoform X1 [Aix galericulata]|nr:Anterior gradient protein 2-like protein isoform X1 [Aix galericulata]